jgi:hypothetical protein
MPWKVVTIVWPALVAALLPLDLPRALALLPDILARLDALDAIGKYRNPYDRSKPSQVDDFRSRFASRIRAIG